MSTYLVACACEIDHILSLLNLHLFYIHLKFTTYSMMRLRQRKYISFFYSYFYFRSVACSLRLNPPTSVFLCGARSVQGRGGVCVCRARVESRTVGTMYEYLNALFSSAFDQLLGEGELSAFSDESRILCKIFAKTLVCSFTVCVIDAFYRTGYYARCA